ncbi:crossover junction endodeoxyribonuclease RuvC [Candidatus Fermentibacteria bacterium]|nr:crossover junction endodeoxyribonuclease RuvC [Candidatus Fermentibacteria bacterium]
MAATGYGLIDVMGSQGLVRVWGVIRTSPQLGLSERLAILFTELQAVVEREHPHEMAVEDGFFGKNPRTALIIGQTRGIALLVASLCELRVHLYSPAEVKLALTGSGSASKDQVGFMVRRLLRLGDEKIPADCTDALAVAMCRSQRMRFDERIGKTR